jgi:hypothetical protein
MGYHIDEFGYDSTYEKPVAGVAISRREVLKRRIASHDRSAAKAMEELDRLESMPEEPTNDPNIIYFEKSFYTSEKKYTYVAVKAGDGLWYSSGPKAPKGYTWEELWEFMSKGVDEVWIVTDLELLSG